ncbi:MAG: dinitrogenase iron-molybdenum cofactor biosynthesis protein [Pseudomonadota bacterium]
MTTPQISRDVALRVGLAARVLPGIAPARLITVLESLVGLPLDEQKLESITVQDLKKGISNLDEDDEGSGGGIDTAYYKQAVEHLWGDREDMLDLPEPSPYRDGDMPGSTRVACASNRRDILDGHFGSCPRFLIYQVSVGEVRLIDIRSCAESFKAEDKNAYRAELIADCDILYVQSIGGPAAAKVVKTGVYPIKWPQAGPAVEAMAELQRAMERNPPPWLAKVMGIEPNMRYGISEEEDEV